MRGVYQSERRFGGSSRTGPEGYRIPLPPGSWTVTLHFAELWHRKRGARVFDVLIEGKPVLDRHEPLAAGFATADRKRFEVEVVDGLLEIDFRLRTGEATVSAIEIEPR